MGQCYFHSAIPRPTLDSCIVKVLTRDDPSESRTCQCAPRTEIGSLPLPLVWPSIRSQTLVDNKLCQASLILNTKLCNRTSGIPRRNLGLWLLTCILYIVDNRDENWQTHQLYGSQYQLTLVIYNPCDLGIMLIQQHQTILLLKLQ